jgi:hypothetical protein
MTRLTIGGKIGFAPPSETPPMSGEVEVEPRIIVISDRVRILETSSDGEWVDGYCVEWQESGTSRRVELPTGATIEHAQRVALAFAGALGDTPDE